MTHAKNISKQRPARAESLLVANQKVAIFAAFAAAIGTLAESVGAWIGLAGGDEKE